MREGHENRIDLYAKAKAQGLQEHRNEQVEDPVVKFSGVAYDNLHDMVNSDEANHQLDEKYEGRPFTRYFVHTGLKVAANVLDTVGGRRKYWKK